MANLPTQAESDKPSVPDRCDMACGILQATNDGDDLSPPDLAMVEDGVNGALNALGWSEFVKLHEHCTGGTYRKPWLFGIEHLTRDHEGYVYWKGEHVEHYSRGAGKEGAQELARRCRIVEKRGQLVTVTSVIWNWVEVDGRADS